MTEFNFGKCIYCGEEKALKDGVCFECKDNINVPDFMKQLFGGFKDEK